MRTKRGLHFLASFGGAFEINRLFLLLWCIRSRNTHFGVSRQLMLLSRLWQTQAWLWTVCVVRQKLFSKLKHYHFCMYLSFIYSNENLHWCFLLQKTFLTPKPDCRGTIRHQYWTHHIWQGYHFKTAKFYTLYLSQLRAQLSLRGKMRF